MQNSFKNASYDTQIFTLDTPVREYLKTAVALANS